MHSSLLFNCQQPERGWLKKVQQIRQQMWPKTMDLAGFVKKQADFGLAGGGAKIRYIPTGKHTIENSSIPNPTLRARGQKNFAGTKSSST